MSNWYVTRNDLKTRLGIASSDTADDAVLDVVIEAVSREIDNHCHRWFYPATQTRYYTADDARCLQLDADLLSVSSLDTLTDNSGGTRTYGNTWATTDYDLLPANAQNEQPPQPYWEIHVNPQGSYWFPFGYPLAARGVKVTGSWGYFDQRTTSSATVNGSHTNSTTTLAVSDGTQLKVGHTLLIGSEQLFVSAISNNNLTVTRGVNGTTAAAISDGATIQTYSYPVVSEAALFSAEMSFRSSKAGGDQMGGGEFGTQVRAIGLHPFVKRMLEPFTRWAVA